MDSFENKLSRQILLLPYEKQLLFCIAISKELFSDYQEFSKTHNWGNPDVLIDAIRLCEATIQKDVDTAVLKNTVALVYEITPDTEDFGDWSGSYALNACTSVIDTLEFILDKNSNHLNSIATYYTDTIDFKIQESGVEEALEIDKHPMLEAARGYLLNLAI